MLLKNGSKGDDVKKLQEKLGLTADGAFGPGTEAKVKAWQAANGLTADGIVGDGTWGKMFASTPVNPQITDSVTSGSPFKLEKLKGHIPDSVIAQIPDTAVKFGIDSALKLAHFLSQCGHESAGFKLVQENLNYSADGLKKIFPKYFPGNLNESYARQPEKIANKVYGGRMGNGAEATGEGWKYHGRGFIQLTGKDNYTAFSKDIGEDCVTNPDLVGTKYPLASAAWFFKRCLSKCTDDSVAAVTAVTLCVNGGKIGLDDRIKHFNEYYALLA
jgi:putative chitinase